MNGLLRRAYSPRNILRWLPLAVINGLIAFLIASSAQGQECRKRTLSSKPFYMPTGLFCQIGDDGMTCFTLEEYKKLLEMDLELHAEKEKTREKDSIITNQGLVLQQNQIVIKTLESDKKILDEQSVRLGNKWRECLEEQEGLPWSSIGIGAGAGVLAGIVAGIVTYLALSTPDRAE